MPVIRRRGPAGFRCPDRVRPGTWCWVYGSAGWWRWVSGSGRGRARRLRGVFWNLAIRRAMRRLIRGDWVLVFSW